MMDKDKLRKADIFSGSIICLVGLWIISQSIQMPMKDSWGGVQNVWFVSPAIFPLFVGAMISLLGALLIRAALKEVGAAALGQALRWIFSPNLLAYSKTAASRRFYAIVVLLFSFVYLNIPRIDFFLSSVLFLMAFITMFYFDDDKLLMKLLRFYCFGTVLFIVIYAGGIASQVSASVPFFADWVTLLFIGAYCFYVRRIIRDAPSVIRKKFKLSVTLSVAAPFIIGPIFKYLLLVPMPTEGLVVFLMDAIRYGEF